MTGAHVSVMLREAVDALNVKRGGRYVDGTLGRAGHTREILARGGFVLGIDRDDDALAAVSAQALEGLTVAKGNHGSLKTIAESHGWSQVDGVLLDLGVSSPQLDEAERGFSFLHEGPLDMRMDRADGMTAADLIATESAEGLAEIFRTLGEEPQARRIAKAIVRAREAGERFATTTALTSFVERTIGRTGARHPATRVFQALRMAVNDEMGELERALDGALALLAPRGRFAVITFESLTDRVVKRFFAAHVGQMRSLQQGGEVWEGEMPRAQYVFKKAVTATAEEVQSNPRSRSAKLRAIEKEEEGK